MQLGASVVVRNPELGWLALLGKKRGWQYVPFVRHSLALRPNFVWGAPEPEWMINYRIGTPAFYVPPNE